VCQHSRQLGVGFYCAIKINNLGTLTFKLRQLLRDPARLESLKASARRIGRPQAAFDVARIALEWPSTEI